MRWRRDAFEIAHVRIYEIGGRIDCVPTRVVENEDASNTEKFFAVEEVDHNSIEAMVSINEDKLEASSFCSEAWQNHFRLLVNTVDKIA